MNKIWTTFTVCLLISNSSRAVKKPLLRIETINHVETTLINGITSPDQDLNASARLNGCQEALDNYAQQLKELRVSPLGHSERARCDLIIADAKQMQDIITPTSPEMGERFAALICLAEKLFIQKISCVNDMNKTE